MPCEEIFGPFTQYKTGRIIRKTGFWCSTLKEAQDKASKKSVPYVCFVYEDGPEDHPYRAIPGWGCAHFVAHELKIRTGSRHETCSKGYSVQISQIKQGRTQLGLRWAKERDVWVSEDGGHSGYVIDVDNSGPRVKIRACSVSGQKYTRWAYDGSVWQKSSPEFQYT